MAPTTHEGGSVFIIGIDPHRGSHAAVVIDRSETVRRVLVLPRRSPSTRTAVGWATRLRRGSGPSKARPAPARCWPSSSSPPANASLTCPPKLSARVRDVGQGADDKTDPHDARSAAIVALRKRQPAAVAVEDHIAVLRLLARATTTSSPDAPGRLPSAHRPCATSQTDEFPRRLRADQAASDPARDPPDDHDRRRTQSPRPRPPRRAPPPRPRPQRARRRIRVAVTASGTTVTDVHGVGPIVAAYIIGHTGDIRRFPTAGHYARYNATAPIEASIGPKNRHRLNPARQPPTQPRAPHRRGHPGRPRHPRPRLLPTQTRRGQSRKEALRALKRRISDAVYRQLLADAAR